MKKHMANCFYNLFFLNEPTPASFVIYFWCFQSNIITNFTASVCQKMFIQYTVPGFEPRPSEHESPPITTGPRFPPCLLLAPAQPVWKQNISIGRTGSGNERTWKGRPLKCTLSSMMTKFSSLVLSVGLLSLRKRNSTSKSRMWGIAITPLSVEYESAFSAVYLFTSHPIINAIVLLDDAWGALSRFTPKAS